MCVCVRYYKNHKHRARHGLPIVTLIVCCINAMVVTDHSRVPAVFIDPGKQGRGPGQVENRDNILPGLGEMSQCDVE